MRQRLGPVVTAVRIGCLWGGIAAFVALAGMVEVFADRQIVAEVVSFGRVLPFLAALGAGYQAAGGIRGRRLDAALRGLIAGGAAGAIVAGLVIAGSVLNLRTVFVNASPVLFSLLSFGWGVEGAYLPAVVGGAAGVVGASGSLLGGRALRPIVTGLTCVLVLGLFQEMVQLILADGTVSSMFRAFLFTPDALSIRGAITVFVLVTIASSAWVSQGGRARMAVRRLAPGLRRGLRLMGAAAGVAALLVLPLVAGPFLSHVLVLVGLYVLMGLGLNLEVGYAGLLDLGFVAFFAIGAYTVGLLTSVGGLGIADVSFWTAVPIAVVVSLIAGVILGVPVLRIRGDYLAIATLGFGEIIRLLVLSDFLRPWLGGSQGVLSIPKPVVFGLELSGPQHLFYLTLACSALVAFVAGRLRDSRLGRAWMALREDEDVAEAMGINLVNVKLLAYGLGAAFAGVSGAIFAVMVGSVFPHSFQLLISINVLALIIVGGMGSMPGVVVGALFLVGLPEMLREFADYRFLIYGAALVLMMQLRPEGLWPTAAIKRELHAADDMEAPRHAA